MKFCNGCKQKKLLSEFNRKGKGIHSRCKSCCKLYWLKWYKKNSDKHKRNNVIFHKQQRIVWRRKFAEYLSQHPCVDCQISDIRVLEFDHCKGEKFKDISAMMRGLYSWNRILKEIEKCAVVCSNCHKIRTYNRTGSYRLS